MIKSERLCLSYDLLYAILSPSKFVYNISIKICIVVMDVVMMLLVPAYSVNVTCSHNNVYVMMLSTDKKLRHMLKFNILWNRLNLNLNVKLYNLMCFIRSFHRNYFIPIIQKVVQNNVI